MSVNNIQTNSNSLGLLNTANNKAAKTENKAEQKEKDLLQAAQKSSSFTQDLDTAAIYESGSKKESVAGASSFQQMLDDSNKQVESFKKLFESLLNKQSEKFRTAHPELNVKSDSSDDAAALSERIFGKGVTGNVKDLIADMEFDDETIKKAQEDISDDGYFGVKQTSKRILDFAKAMSGGDPDKLEVLYNAMEDGYAKAEKIWGGELPQICQDTHEAVRKGFDDMRAEFTGGKSTDEFESQAMIAAVGSSAN